MITKDFGNHKDVTFHDDGSVVLPATMTADEFAEFMPLAMHVYHSRQMPALCQSVGPYSVMGGKLVGGKIAKKRGRPATKSATAKRGRPRKA